MNSYVCYTSNLLNAYFLEREGKQLSYILFDVQVRLARDGEPARESFYTDLHVDTCARPSRRYTYGEAYRPEGDISWYVEPRETLAWHELLIIPEDFEKQAGFKTTAAEMKLARGRAIDAARDKVRAAETELRRLEA